MSESKPKLKLSFSFAQPPDTSSTVASTSQAGSPPPQSEIRTPSIKLNFGKQSTPVATDGRTFTPPAKKRKVDPAASVPDSAKKRKPNAIKQELGKGATAGGRESAQSPQRKLTLTTKALQNLQAPPERPAAPARTSTLKIIAKGKIPKRELGNGWDSENEETEKDPVILEGFILRMQPGSDCDYLHKHITEGTMGLDHRQGGANVRFRLFDTHGRRGMMMVREHPYAIAMVDLPCVVEGMKTWDKKAAVKSMDISQMLLVLGPCKNQEEAMKYPLPPEVDPKTHNYAHGLTPPMHYVRKRRFDKTKRAKLEDIEEVERRVKALLAADKAAKKVSWRTYDHDPTDELAEEEDNDDDGEEYSATDEDDDEDADGEEEDREPVDYFHNQPGRHDLVETPGYNDSPAMMDEDDEDEGDIEREFMLGLDNADDEADDADTGTSQPDDSAKASQHLQARGETEGGSSFAVTSTSASPSANIDTPGGGTSTGPAGSPTNQTPADEESDDDDNDPSNEVSDAEGSDANADDDEGEGDEDDDEQAKEQDEALQEAKDNIVEMENKIRQVRAEIGTKQKGSIVARKLREKAEGLEGEVEGLRRKWGL